MAQTFKEMKAGIGPEGERGDRAYPPVMEYFIRRGHNESKGDVFLRTMNRRLDSMYKLSGIPTGNSEQELWEGFRLRPDAVEEKEGSARLVQEGSEEEREQAFVVELREKDTGGYSGPALEAGGVPSSSQDSF